MSNATVAPGPLRLRGANIDYSTFGDWMHKGQQATWGKYRDFLLAVYDAEAQAVLMAVRTVRLKIVGGWHKVPMRDKDGNYVFKRDQMTGEILRDAGPTRGGARRRVQRVRRRSRGLVA